MTQSLCGVVDDNEKIARIVSKEWIVDGELQQTAFVLKPRETYLSVNRLSVHSYAEDVANFVSNHPKFLFEENSYQRALLSVSAVRAIDVFDEAGEKLDINVEVEAREAHVKSHAGIFVRSDSTNIIPERMLPDEMISKDVSVNTVLQDIRWGLLELAELQECKI